MTQIVLFILAGVLGFWIGGFISHFSSRFDLVPDKPPSSSRTVRLAIAATLGIQVLIVDFSKEWFISVPFVAALIMICFLDVRYKVIPNFITLPGIIIAAALRIWIHPLPYMDYIGASLLGAGIFYVIALMMQITSKGNSVGGGDIKLLCLTGLVLGIKLSILAFMLFCLAGMIAGIVIVLTGKYRKEMVIPFGPFIACSSLICYFWGSDFENWIIANLIL